MRITELRPERVFLYTGIVFGVIFLLMLPPMKANDEWKHLYRAWNIADGHMKPSKQEGSSVPGGYVPIDMIVTAGGLLFDVPYSRENVGTILYMPYGENTIPDPFSGLKRKNRLKVITSFLKATHEDVLEAVPGAPERVFTYFPNTALYTPVPYMPQVTGIFLGKTLGVSTLLLIYMGRIMNLLIWLVFVYYAIKLSPFYKWLLCLVALTPVSLYLAASLSADATTNALSFLLFAQVLRASRAERGQLSTATLVSLAALCVVVSLCKSYFLVPLFVLYIGYGTFGTRKRFFVFISLTYLIIFSLMFLWAMLVKDLYVPIFDGVDMKAQLTVIRHDPAKLISVSVNTLRTYIGQYLNQFIGTLGHHGNVRLSGLMVFINMLVLALACIADTQQGDAIELTRWQRLITLLCVFINLAFLVIFAYLYNTPPGKDLIAGLQGRYVYPFVLMIFLLFYPTRKLVLALQGVRAYRSLIFTIFIWMNLLLSSVVILRGYYA